jgi:Tfp pilus assembly protein PilZ
MAAYVLAPIGNVALVWLFGGVPLSQIVQRLFQGYGSLATVWLLTAPLVGLSLFLVSRFTWYLFIGHSLLILGDFVYKWIDRPQFYLETVDGALNMMLLVGNLALVGIVLYIIQRDFRSPYFQVLQRNFRESRRVPMEHHIAILGRRARITDLSAGGCFVAQPNLPLSTEHTVQVGLSAGNMDLLCKARVMRQTDEGFGLMFTGLRPRERKALSRFISQRYKLRYRVDIPAVWITESGNREVHVRDMSAGGCYVSVADAHVAVAEVGTPVHLDLIAGDHRYHVHGRVAWTNGNGDFGKPPGFGVAYSRRHRRILRRILESGGRPTLTR